MAGSRWQVIAERLASRLANHAHCDEHRSGNPGRDCPSCDDRAAYEEWLAAGGRDHRLYASGRSVSLDELRARTP